MQDPNLRITEAVYDLIHLLPRRDNRTLKSELPANGIYIFFEQGETIQYRDIVTERAVRVGINTSDVGFPDRIYKHYGNNRKQSIFRKHIGKALLTKENPKHPLLRDWGLKTGPPLPEIEQMVSDLLYQTFTFCCFAVDEAEERQKFETSLIALFAQHPLGKPSAGWLGRYAVNERIRRSGLWNCDDIDKTPLTRSQFPRPKELIKATIE